MVTSLAIVHDCGYSALMNILFISEVMKTIQIGGSSRKIPGGTPSFPADFSHFKSDTCSPTSSSTMGSSVTGIYVSEVMLLNANVSSDPKVWSKNSLNWLSEGHSLLVGFVSVS